MIERYAFKFGKFVKKTKHYGKNKLDKAAAILSATLALPVGKIIINHYQI